MDEHQFRCTVCLDLFTDPVSTPCGHNFCKACLKKHWDTTEVCCCPLCKQMFYDRPELRVNVSFREVVDHFKNMSLNPAACSESCMAKPGDAACDVCTGTKVKATKSCLVCMASYCDVHLEPHKTSAALCKHKLIEPVRNLEERICQTHEKILELYCKREERFICQVCADTDHSRHQVVTAEVASQQKMIHIKRREREVELMIQDRLKRIEGINQSRIETKENAQKQMEASVQVFTSVIEAINKTHEDLMEEIEERHDAEQKRFERLIIELNQEIDELEKKNTELQQLSQIEDHITLLQTFTKAYALPTARNWANIPVYQIDFLGYIRTSLKNAQQIINTEIRKQESVELQKMKKFADDITIDPNTAGSWLTVSEDQKEVWQSPKKFKLLSITLRSGERTFAAATQGLTTGRHYWEVGVKQKSNWALGVASRTFIKGEPVTPCPKNGMWGISHHDGEQYLALMEHPFPLMLSSKPQRVGVFVDYEEGQVSFFNAETKTCIFTVRKCNFTEKVYPVFDPCMTAEKKEVAPLRLMIVEITK